MCYECERILFVCKQCNNVYWLEHQYNPEIIKYEYCARCGRKQVIK
jgi:hypothetical protein